MTRIFTLSLAARQRIAGIALLALGVVFEYLSRKCRAMRDEIATWDEGRVFSLSVLQNGPSVTFKKECGAIRYLGFGLKQPDLTIYFKNIDSALMVFTGMMGAQTAFVQRRAIVHGDIGAAMELQRAIIVAMTYLMPGFVLKSTFIRPPKLSFSELLFKAWVMIILAPGMIAAARR